MNRGPLNLNEGNERVTETQSINTLAPTSFDLKRALPRVL